MCGYATWSLAALNCLHGAKLLPTAIKVSYNSPGAGWVWDGVVVFICLGFGGFALLEALLRVKGAFKEKQSEDVGYA